MYVNTFYIEQLNTKMIGVGEMRVSRASSAVQQLVTSSVHQG